MTIDRFVKAQKYEYSTALKEIKKGQKTSHWIWYIFPQIKGLGQSSISKKYGLEGIEEAREYLSNPVLRNHLYEISNELLKHKDKDINTIMGSNIDAVKLKSCMTLFNEVEPNSIFEDVLESFYNGEKDEKTLTLIKK